MKTKRNLRNSKKLNISKYVPVLIILFSLTIIVGSTFAYFTDRKEDSVDLTFSKVELSSETTTGINGVLRDVIPGTPLISSKLSFSKSIDSEPIYVRAKLSFKLPKEYENDANMQELLNNLRSATDYNINQEPLNGAIWSEKEGNYFYLVESSDTTKLKKVDDITTYVLSNEIVIPRDLKNLDENAQYMKSINFHFAFEAIQADNVSNVKIDTKETFNTLFPGGDDEVEQVEVSFVDENGANITTNIIKSGEKITSIEFEIDDPTMSFMGWFTDSDFTNKFDFDSEVTSNITLYPKLVTTSDPALFEFDENTIVKYNGTESEIIIPVSYKLSDTIETEETVTFATRYELQEALNELDYEESIVLNLEFKKNTTTSKIRYLDYPLSIGEIDTDSYREFYDYNEFYTYLKSLSTGESVVVVYSFTRNSSYQSYSNLTYPLSYTTTKVTKIYEYGNDVKVTSIGSELFKDNTTIKKVTILENITDIDGYVFQNCTNLETVEFPKNITTIPSYAFSGCGSLDVESVLDGMTRIGSYAFEGCNQIESISLGDCKLSDGVFKDCINLKTVEFSEGLTTIPSYCFDGCTSLELNELPNTITSIEGHSFEGCTNLKLTSLPNSLTSIGYASFRNCTNLRLTSLPNSLTSIGYAAFENCTNLRLTSLPDSVTNIDSYAFENCTNINISVLPSSIESIGSNIFYNCSFINYVNNLFSMKINGTDEYVILGSQNLTSISNIVWPGKVRIISSSVFWGASSLKNVILPEGVQTIEYAVFVNCTSLEVVIANDELNSVDSAAFNGCDNLKYVLAPNEEVANKLKNIYNIRNYVYQLQESGGSNLTYTSASVGGMTIYTATSGGKKWVRTGTSSANYKYYKSIV